MTVDLEQQLSAIAADVAIVGPGQVRLSTGATYQFGTAGAPASGLIELLYARHYCRPGQLRTEAVPPDDQFLAELVAANRIVARAGMPREMVTGGHYFALGRPTVDAVTGRQVRFYWNVAPDGAAPLLALLAARLERRRIPFQFKVPVAPAGYDRADGGVLYCAAEDVAALIDIVGEACAALGPSLRDDVPLFARRLAPGLALAESPQGGESFGMHRCRLLAEGLIAGQAAGTDPREAMVARLTAYGLRPDSLERNPGTAFPYAFEGFGA